MTRRRIIVAGAGIIGLWQALTLARRDYQVMLVDREVEPLNAGASRHAGAMLAPWVEAESAPDEVRDFGVEGLSIWRDVYPGVVNNGSLVVAVARDLPDLTRFAKLTHEHRTFSTERRSPLLSPISPTVFRRRYSFRMRHTSRRRTRSRFCTKPARMPVSIFISDALWKRATGETVIVDCRGLGARHRLADLRGVRGERLLIRSSDVSFARPVRLLHPRHPLYVVPWGDNRYLVGATMIESEDAGPVSVRSALELLGAAYALHPAFGEAEVLEMSAGVRPAFPDNVPRARVVDGGRSIMVNGAYRHGYLLAPVLAAAVADYLDTGALHPLLQT